MGAGGREMATEGKEGFISVAGKEGAERSCGPRGREPEEFIPKGKK